MSSMVYRKSTKAQRHKMLERIRGELGDVMFAEFMIDTLTVGGDVEILNYPTLAAVWLHRKAMRISPAVASGARGEQEAG